MGPKWAALFTEPLPRGYQAGGVAKNLHFDHFQGGHRWSGRIAFPLFDQVLKS
ncbi:MAG: hypothetical protein GY917_11675 [Planctomycetaceae bacterium]|nr:hypothetical protein [Planctomycetaceae bacterium]